MYEVKRRPLTLAERDQARDAYLATPGPLDADMGALLTASGVALLIGFAVGAFVGMVVAGLMGGQALEYVASGGGSCGVIALGLVLYLHLAEARREGRDRRQMRQGTYDFGNATDIRCETNGAVCCAGKAIARGPVWFLALDGAGLLVLHGHYLEGLREKHGFPHERLRLLVSRLDQVVLYEGEGTQVPVRRLDPDACTAHELTALNEAPDHEAIPGGLDTCAQDLVRKTADAWRFMHED